MGVLYLLHPAGKAPPGGEAAESPLGNKCRCWTALNSGTYSSADIHLTSLNPSQLEGGE